MAVFLGLANPYSNVLDKCEESLFFLNFTFEAKHTRRKKCDFFRNICFWIFFQISIDCLARCCKTIGKFLIKFFFNRLLDGKAMTGPHSWGHFLIRTVEIVSHRSWRLNVGPPLKLVMNQPFFSWKHFFFEYEPTNIPSGQIWTFISCLAKEIHVRSNPKWNREVPTSHPFFW